MSDVRRFRVSGPPAALAVALDRVVVRCAVRGVVESDGAFEVAVEGGLPGLDGVEVEELDAAVPVPTGLEEDRPIRVSDGIVVRPPWVEPVPGFGGVELVVPRANAFGSGEHGSTRAALCMMERVWTARIGSLADVGTGSGILLLYARARGCLVLLACDVEPEAVAAAAALVPGATVVEGGPARLLEVGGPADAVVANLRGDELRACLTDVQTLWNGSGPLVLSGLRPAECEELERSLGTAERITCDGYVALGIPPRR